MIHDENQALLADAAFTAALSPVRKQLLGGIGRGIPGQIEGDHSWGRYPQTTPLYGFLAERSLLDPGHPPPRP